MDCALNFCDGFNLNLDEQQYSLDSDLQKDKNQQHVAWVIENGLIRFTDKVLSKCCLTYQVLVKIILVSMSDYVGMEKRKIFFYSYPWSYGHCKLKIVKSDRFFLLTPFALLLHTKPLIYICSLFHTYKQLTFNLLYTT